MKKRLLALVLALCLLTALLSVCASAADQKTILKKLQGSYANQIVEVTGKEEHFQFQFEEPYLDQSWGDDEFSGLVYILNLGPETATETGFMVYDSDGNILRTDRFHTDGEIDGALEPDTIMKCDDFWLYVIDDNKLLPKGIQIGQTLYWRIYLIIGDTQYLSEEQSFVVSIEGSRFESTFSKPAEPEPEPPKPVENPFSDVKKGDYFYDPVLWALNRTPQITDGTTETTFSPNDTCTRGQVVTFLWRAMGCAEPSSLSNPFTDVKTSDYFYEAVLWAVEHGITDGTGVTTFSPEAPCTRGHVVTFLYRTEGAAAMRASAFDATVYITKTGEKYHSANCTSLRRSKIEISLSEAQSRGYTPCELCMRGSSASKSAPAPQTVAGFRDVLTDAYYAPAVVWAVENTITNGTSDTTFSPADPCTRGQIVTFLYRDMQ